MTTAASPAKGTEYVVLGQEQAPEGYWLEVGRATAANDLAAIKAAVESATPEQLAGAVVFVAVPARSWRPRTKKTKVVETESWA